MEQQYEVARLSDYGFKDYKVLKKIWKIISWALVVFTILLMYISIIVILIQSFNSSKDTNSFGHISFEAYTNMFNESQLMDSIKNTFLVSIIATIISTICGTLIAVGINALEKKKRSQIILLNNIPLLNADIVTGTSLMLIFSVFMFAFPYIFGLQTLIMAHVYFCLPYVILSVLPKLKEIDKNMYDAAIDLNIKPFKALGLVIIPAIKSGIFSGLILAFTMSFDDFVISYYTTGNGFDNLSIWIYSSIGRNSLSPSVYAFSTLVTFVSMIALIVSNKLGGKKKNAKKK